MIAAAIDDESIFVLPPLPNTLFTRDSSCWIYGGVSINPMYWPARRLEAHNVAAIYRYHPMFADAEAEAPFGGGPAEEIWRSVQLDEIGKSIARSGGIGLASAIERELVRLQAETEDAGR